MSKRSSSDEAAIASLVLSALVVLVLLGWLAVQAIVLVVRMLAAHPGNLLLWSAAGVAGTATLLALLTAGHVAVLNLLAGLALMSLVFTAWAVQTYHETLFKRVLTRERLVKEVLGPWW